MNVFFKKISLKKYKLSELELKVFDYMQHNQNELTESTLTELSNNIFVSSATVSRTCQKLGFSGFSEFQYAYNNFIKTNNELIVKYSDPNEYFKKIIEELHANVNSYSEKKINKVVEKLINSRRVEIFGVGRTASVCHEGATKLTFAGKVANARSDWDEQRSVSRHLSDKDLALIVSISGETPEVIRRATMLKQNKVKTVSIIGTQGTTLESLTDDSIIINITPTYINDVDVSSHFLISILFDIISTSYMKEHL